MLSVSEMVDVLDFDFDMEDGEKVANHFKKNFHPTSFSSSLFNNNIWVVKYRSSISAKNVSFWTVLVNRYIISKAGMAISGMQTSESPLITLAFFSFTSKCQCRAGASEVSPEPSLV